MSGLFNRLAQRTLGTASVVRPAIAPRFSQPSMAINELPLTEPTEEINLQTREKINKNDNQKLNKPVINHELVSNQIQEKFIDSPILHEQSRQVDVQQSEHLVDIQPRDKSKKTEKKLLYESIDNPIKLANNKNKTQTILAETKTETIVDEPLVSMPDEHNQNIENPNTHFGDSDFYQTSGNDRSNRDNISKQQSQEENQTINVTIGRVEVRAVHPSPAPIKQSKTKNKSTLSLDDYLQQRQRGER